MATAGLLSQYMYLVNQKTYAESELVKWENWASNASSMLSKQESYGEKWEDSSCAIYDDWGESKYYTAGGETFYQPKLSASTKYREVSCSLYANAKVPKYDPEKLEEYTDMDMEYDTMVSMYDTLVTELESQAESVKEQLGTNASETGLIGS